MARIAALVLCLFVSVPHADSAGKLRVLALSSAPFFSDDGGAPSGIELDILAYFAKARDQELEIEYVSSFPELLERIERGDADIASGTITITSERENRLDFSAPYFPVQVVLVERSGETSDAPAALSGKKVGAFAQTTAEDALNAIGGVEVVQRPGLDGLLDAVASGEIHGAAADSSAVIPVIDDYPGLEISLTFGEPQDFGFALPKGSSLKEPLSEHIRSLKESGIYFRLVTKHMGPQASAVVRAARAP